MVKSDASTNQWILPIIITFNKWPLTALYITLVIAYIWKELLLRSRDCWLCMWSYFALLPLAKQHRGDVEELFLALLRWCVACLPTIHWLTLSIAAPRSGPKQTPLCCSPLFGCLPLPLSSYFSRCQNGCHTERKKLRRKKIIHLEVVYVGDMDRGCWWTL